MSMAYEIVMTNELKFGVASIVLQQIVEKATATSGKEDYKKTTQDKAEFEDCQKKKTRAGFLVCKLLNPICNYIKW